MFSFWRARSNFLTSNKKLNKEPDIFGKQLANIGLKELIGRPHNLYAEHNDKGEITKYVIKIVYTPFSKKDVHVSVKDNTLNIEIGKENLSPEKNCVYCGISRQRERISMYLSDRNVEFEKITAKCDDGILTIELPVNKSKSSRVIEIV
jgi:HSP20 family molecular chaperone IbpA